ncbi:3-oxoacyl-ACP synthase III family protein [Roseibium litorale]|uniref:Beta-ketoacyl-ACP synthase 3 n=1 Tax=Roseibium litorale TaxID=2803841 RepID=A0ABR9CKE9_9HYPH|nr:beta-ketoacyl-ACP synthase 3 [Roseibium litorale]MBD8891315.1 beta-ketoacyl-ACP synthase 3 [Roseibium litorale]
MASLRFISTGVCRPNKAITNEDIACNINTRIDPDWVERTLGIRQRYVAENHVQTSDLAAAAIADLLDRAKVDAGTVDLLLLATCSPDKRAPATACLVQHKAGLANAVAFDISAVCSGFLYALSVAAAMLHTGSYRRAIVVGADMFSRVTDWQRRDCVFFGDGAGAVLLEAGGLGTNALFDAELYTDSCGRDAFSIDGSDSPFNMDGAAVFQAASNAVPACIDQLLKRNSLSADSVDIVIPHQPSHNLLREIARRAGIGFEKFQLSMGRHANTVGATIPIALHDALEAGRLSHGDCVLFAAAGAGFTAGAAIHYWN